MLSGYYRIHRLITYIALLSIVHLCGFSSSVFATLPDQYQSYSAEKKQNILWENLSQSNRECGIPDANSSGWGETIKKIKALFSLGATFDYVGDELPGGRVKFIHGVGSVGKVQFLPVSGHPFTGIYQSGGIGLARLSLALSPDNASYTPGIALKFLVDSQPSLNVVAMYSLEGQKKNWNFFANDFTTKIDHPTSVLLKMLEWIFKWTRNPANDLPVSHLAEVYSNGDKVEKPLSPEMLTLKPSETINQIIDPKSRADFRESLLSIPQGTMYEVYGIFKGNEYHVGTIQLESELLASEYGDKQLFFQHKR